MHNNTVLSLFLRNRGLWRPASVFSMWCDDVMWSWIVMKNPTGDWVWKIWSFALQTGFLCFYFSMFYRLLSVSLSVSFFVHCRYNVLLTSQSRCKIAVVTPPCSFWQPQCYHDGMVIKRRNCSQSNTLFRHLLVNTDKSTKRLSSTGWYPVRHRLKLMFSSLFLIRPCTGTV